MPAPPILRHYIITHPVRHGNVTLDHGALVGVLICLVLLAGWAAWQSRFRCAECGSWPVRCRCTQPAHPDRRSAR
jgi:hypothetical protein